MAAEQNQQLKQAIAYAQAGQRDEAHALLEQILRQDPQMTAAWLWLATVANSDDERTNALLQVIKLDPTNASARSALEKLGVIVPPPHRAEPAPEPLPSWLNVPPDDPMPKSTQPFLSPREWSIILIVGVIAIFLVFTMLIGGKVVNNLLQTATPTPSPTFTLPPTLTPTITPTPMPTFTPAPIRTLPPQFTDTPTSSPAPTNTRRPSFTPLPTTTPFVFSTPSSDPDQSIFGS